MNTLTNIKQRVRAAYKGRPRQTRSVKRREVRNEVQDAIRAAALDTDITFSTVNSPSRRMESCTEPRESLDQGAKTDRQESRPDQDFAYAKFAGADEIQEMAAQDEVGDASILKSSPTESLLEQFEIRQELEPGPAFEDEQALRNKAYVVSTGEEPDDYTNGPARLVVASDGVKLCAALLLTLDLSSRIQKSLRAQRDFAKAERAAVRQLQVCLNFEDDLRREIANHESRLAALREEGAIDSVAEESLKTELYVLEEMFNQSSIDRKCMQSNLENRATILREIQAETNVVLEEAFVHARLLEPEIDEPDTPIEERDLQKEYQAFCRTFGMDTGGSVAPLDTNNDHLRAVQEPMTAQQEQEEKLKEAVWSTYDHLRTTQIAFDHRALNRARAWQINVETVARGGKDVYGTPEEFDLAWLKREQDLTHGLIEAESAFATAKAAAVEAGIDVPLDDRSSGFVEDVADGYRMSMEHEQIASVPSPKVKTGYQAFLNLLHRASTSGPKKPTIG